MGCKIYSTFPNWQYTISLVCCYYLTQMYVSCIKIRIEIHCCWGACAYVEVCIHLYIYIYLWIHIYIYIHFENCLSNTEFSWDIIAILSGICLHFDRLQGQYKSKIWRLKMGNRSEQLFKEHLKVMERVCMVAYNNINGAITLPY